jgi:hypothetical protein
MSQQQPRPRQRRPRQQTDRIRHARQVLAGDAVRPAPDPWVTGEGGIPLTPLQRNFLILLGVLLLIGAVLAFTDLLLLATIPFFILAIGLIAARFVF